jgi:6,7-dimethyl-8-ribityllumazine synthase
VCLGPGAYPIPMIFLALWLVAVAAALVGIGYVIRWTLTALWRAVAGAPHMRPGQRPPVMGRNP